MKRLVVLLAVFLIMFLVWGSYSNAQEEVPILKNVSVYQQYRETMKDMKFLGETLLDYVEHFNKAPAAQTLRELMKQDCGNGLTVAEFLFDEIPEEQIPLKDVWENDFFYKTQKGRFWIASAGSDGEFKGFEQTGVYPNRDTHVQGKDIIFSNKGFVVFPIEEDKAYFFIRALLEVLSKSVNFVGSDLEF